MTLLGDLLHETKGELGGRCFRGACSNVGARWWNPNTQRYYCGTCAKEINQVGMEECPELKLVETVPCYVFQVKRPRVDTFAWPAVYIHKDLAEKAYGRCSEITEVWLHPDHILLREMEKAP
jgi:hypothetical protein